MNDRELLELAAKAAGYTLEDHYDATDEHWPWCQEIADHWSPLHDDGDALRLAVKLAIDVNQGGDVVVAERRALFDIPEIGVAEAFLSGDDACAATRRAIVRAAAEIGRAMP